MPSQAIQNMYAEFEKLHESRAAGPAPTLAQMREHFAPAGKLFPLPTDVAVSPAVSGAWSAEWLDAPGAQRDRVVLYLHGGGFSIGDLRSHGELAARIGRASHARVLFVRYRLAPEHTFPAAVEDSIAAFRWLRSTQALPAKAIAVAGDSAGGNLAMSSMIALRDAKEPLPAAAAVLSPLVDLTVSGASTEARNGRDPIFNPLMIRGVASGYLGGADPRSPLASPLFAPLQGLPPLLVQVGTEELIYDDAARLHDAAKAAGVDSTLEVGEGLPHVYQTAGDAPEAIAATDSIGAFFARHLRGG